MKEKTSQSAPVEIIVGPYRSGKTKRLLADIWQSARDNPLAKNVIVVPSARIRNLAEGRLEEISKDELSASDRFYSGYFGIRLVSFYEICRQILQHYGAYPTIIGNDLRAAILSRVIARMSSSGDLKELSQIAHYQGTHAAILELIDEFQRAALTPAQVLDSLRLSAASDYRLSELARVYRGYWQALEEMQLSDSHMLAFRARQLLTTNPGTRAGETEATLSSRALFDWLMVDGFDRFNPLQLQVLQGLARQSNRLTITFDYVDEHRPNYETYKQDYLWKESSYKQLLATFGLAAQSPVVRYAEAPASSRSQDVFSCLDQYMELDEIARRCKQLILKENVSPAEILVVMRDLQSYRPSIKPAFESAGVPCFVDESVSVNELPLVQFIERLMRLAADGFKRKELIDCLLSPYCQIKALGLSRADIEAIDKHSLDARLVKGADRWNELHLGGSAHLKKGLAYFIRLASPPSELRTLTDFAGWLESLLDVLLDKTGWASGPAADKDGDANRCLIAVRSAIGALVAEEQILGAQLSDYSTFFAKLDDKLKDANFRRFARTLDGVTICGADFAPNRCYQHVFIAGLVEGQFPRRQSRSGFVSADELACWARFGIPLENPRHHPGFEWALYRSLLERAQVKAHLSFPRYNTADADEMVPSFFLAGSESGSIPFVKPYACARDEPVGVREALFGRLWYQSSDDPPQFPENELVGKIWNELAIPYSVAIARSRGDRQTVYNGFLVDAVMCGAATVTLPKKWSASKINEYGQCPFRFWVSRVLELQPRQEPEVGLDALLLGQTQHKVLEIFFRKFRQRNWRARSTAESDWLPLFQEAFSEGISWLLAQSQFDPGPFWKYDKVEMEFRLKRFLQEEFARFAKDPEDFQPEHVEISFGTGSPGAYPPLVLPGRNREILISGVIDRLDVSPAGRVRVIDYKSGSTSMPPRDAEAGRNVQIPLYALAVEQAILPESKVVRGAYLSVSQGMPSGKFDFEGEEHALPAMAADHVAHFVEAIAGGDFTVRPNGNDVCRSCQHERICRVNEFVLEASDGAD